MAKLKKEDVKNEVGRIKDGDIHYQKGSYEYLKTKCISENVNDKQSNEDILASVIEEMEGNGEPLLLTTVKERAKEKGAGARFLKKEGQYDKAWI